ncbi:hypothetical protein HBN50_02635 [Halobacteriovorax sp. GB3]|uniref:hypothetical protein n=1 Tax=Halobacteriovorax sp. GB3 TaxID=2719615 RepID=UPI002361B714|nr:hypothetical protein [Halobacteriovorax sp. GB3]MDD0851971.1 hypothetical protein [Halobacteriovorax sp. GB3]
MLQQEISPITGIIAEEQVVIDFGEHEGKSVLEVQDTLPEFYDYLIDQKNDGRCTIRRSKDKTFYLYITNTLM